jgi:proteasome lid subunit RPN8/RPN11
MKNPQTKNVQPFSVRVNPDATFLADLHAHLCDSEIIGLLGGYYSKEEKCIYIQAAFPCKSTNRIDSGSTDVEMDPVFQIYATEAIGNHGMRVVGWYHSHPDFQPNPSITDIENQANYQQLFQGSDMTENNGGDTTDVNAEEASPFVGLIVGTYDGKNPESQSVMR